MSINLNYVASENSLELKRKRLCGEASFYSKYLKFTCLEIFLT